MILKEEKRNIFEVDEKYSLAHCISSDCAMGAGIAVDFNKKFRLKIALLQIPETERKHPICWKVGRVYNLITKAQYWHKPTYESIRGAVQSMKNNIIANNIKYLAMPKIGCGLDRLQWGKVREMIQEEFKDIDIEILVCHI